eukprot:6179002-Pleurochrysis_carterae.AAC.4
MASCRLRNWSDDVSSAGADGGATGGGATAQIPTARALTSAHGNAATDACDRRSGIMPELFLAQQRLGKACALSCRITVVFVAVARCA